MDALWLQVSLLDPHQQLHPGQDLWHGARQREPVRAIMIPTCPTFELSPSPAQTGRTFSIEVACSPTCTLSTHLLRPEQGEQATQPTLAKGARHQAAPKVHLKCRRRGVPLS
jgi:hypothetical protein